MISPLLSQVGKSGSKGADRPRRRGEIGGRPKGLLTRPRERRQTRFRRFRGSPTGMYVKYVSLSNFLRNANA